MRGYVSVVLSHPFVVICDGSPMMLAGLLPAQLSLISTLSTTFISYLKWEEFKPCQPLNADSSLSAISFALNSTSDPSQTPCLTLSHWGPERLGDSPPFQLPVCPGCPPFLAESYPCSKTASSPAAALVHCLHQALWAGLGSLHLVNPG